MHAWLCLAILIARGIDNHEPIRKPELAQRVRGAFQSLSSLSFEALVQATNHGISKSPDTPSVINLRVLMDNGLRSRVEAYRESSKYWVVVCDGKQMMEWVADKNEWTAYPLAQMDKPDESFVRQLLVTNKYGPMLAPRYGRSWLGSEAPEQTWLQRIINEPSTKTIRGRTIGGRHCHATKTVLDHSHPEGAVYGSGTEVFKIYFDPSSFLPIRESQSFSGGVLALNMMSAQRQVNYRNVVVNPQITDRDFEFIPPAGATFISPDDPRFAPPPKLEGNDAPSFSLAAIDGNIVKLSDFKGERPVLVVFWATWCGPCVQEVPFLRDLRSEHPSDDLTILAISSEPKMEDIARFAKKKKMTYQVLHDPKKETAKAYQARAIPRTILINRNGIVVKVWQGWSGDEEAKEIRSEIAKLLK